MSNNPIAGIPGVYGVTSDAVNAYILQDDESGIIVVDTGFPGTTRRILQMVENIGCAPDDVKHILITHADTDHVGSLGGLVKATGSPVYASAESARYIQQRQSPPHLPLPMKLISGIFNRLMLGKVSVQHTVSDGDVLPIADGIRVIATPGHTPDHVSYFWERERVLFIGDLIRNDEQLGLTPPAITWDMDAARASARKVLALDPAVICVGHGSVWNAKDDPNGIETLLASLA